MKIFLSYPHKDTAKAKQLKAVIESGGHTVWIDDQLIVSKEWRQQLEDRIKQSDAIVLALTPNWISSSYCQWEFVTAVENGKGIIPVTLEKVTSLPERIGKYQFADLSKGFNEEIVTKLQNDLMTLVEHSSKANITNIDKDDIAMNIDQKNDGGGHNFNVSGDNNTVVGGDNDQNTYNTTFNAPMGIAPIGGKTIFHGNVTISIGEIPAASEDVRETLEQQIDELTAELNKLKEMHSRDVTEVEMATEDAIAEAEKPEPNKDRLQIRGEKLVAAAKNLATVAPIAVKIAKTLLMIG